jgi:hypothetical protein
MKNQFLHFSFLPEKHNIRIHILGCVLLLELFALTTLPAQNTFVEFGKNRVQYKKFNWRSLNAPNFDVYHYDYGARLANFAVRYLETEFDNITDLIGYTPYFKTKIFIYNSISDLQQSNVGIDDFNAIIGGQTDFFKSQVEIPFTGSEVEFKKELRRGLAQMLIKEMMFGGNLKDMVQNSYLGKFSEWFLLGAAAYTAEGWSEQMDDHLRDLIRTGKLRRPALLTGRDAVLVGQSIWNYVAEKYGKANVSSVLNLARIIRNEKNSISSALGVRYNRFLKDWENYYTNAAKEVNENLQDNVYDARLRKNNRKGRIFNEIKINPEGTKVAYSENRNGLYRVVVQDLRTLRRKVMLRKGYHALYQRYDDNIPLLSWRDNNNLGVLYMRKGEAHLEVFNPRGKRNYERVWFYFNHVTSFDFSDDGNFLVLSADRKGEVDFKTGQNDIYLFNLQETNLKAITDDWYDDLYPEFLPNSTQAFTFSSNRLKDTLITTDITDRGNYAQEVNNFDIFIYNPSISQTRLTRIASSPANDLMPRVLDKDNIIYLNEDNGILQLKKYDLNTGKTNTLTQNKQSIRAYDLNNITGSFVYLMSDRGKTYPYLKKTFDFTTPNGSDFQTYRTRLLNARNNQPQTKQEEIKAEGFTDPKQIQPTNPNEKFEADEIDTDNYTFNDDIVKDKQSTLDKVQDKMLEEARKAKQNEVKVIGPYDYRPRFRSENALTTVQIDPFRGWGLLINTTTSDLIENHKLRGGFFMITDLKSSDFFGEYQYLGRRFDITVRYDRKGVFINGDEGFSQRYTLNKMTARLSYPISNTSRISIAPFYTNTLFTSLRTPFVINLEDDRVHYSGIKAEYVFDNTLINGQNMISGTRIKISYENYNATLANANVKADLEASNKNLSIFNFDKIVVEARRYIKLHRDLVLALRTSYGRFGGSSPKSFMIGGMDNWLFNDRDNGGRGGDPLATAPNMGNSDLLFHEFVTNLRGFNYNKLSGHNFLLANAEIRLPVFRYLFGKRLNNNFLNNLQLVGFYDFGSAWNGISPFNKENSINIRRIPPTPGGPFEAIVNDFKSPWLAGYGAGLRSVLLGYYLKLDIAWGIEDFVVKDKPKFYLTFGYDF